MAEIINFQDGKGNVQPPDAQSPDASLAVFVWSCGKCGNTTFQLLHGGAIRCAHCNVTSIHVGHFDLKSNGG